MIALHLRSSSTKRANDFSSELITSKMMGRFPHSFAPPSLPGRFHEKTATDPIDCGAWRWQHARATALVCDHGEECNYFRVLARIDWFWPKCCFEGLRRHVVSRCRELDVLFWTILLCFVFSAFFLISLRFLLCFCRVFFFFFVFLVDVTHQHSLTF